MASGIFQQDFLISEVTCVRTVLYIPPNGEYNKTVLEVADEIGYKTIFKL